MLNYPKKSHPKPIEGRFWSRVNKTSSCWIWTGAKMKNGYGEMSCNGSVYYMHRLSYEIHNGPILGGLWVLHTCDNRICVNPEHLYLGTVIENSRDAKTRNRFNPLKGEKSPISKYKESTILEIRKLYKNGIKQCDITRKFNIPKGTIFHIVHKTRWAHI